jgi:hypothetical protein
MSGHSEAGGVAVGEDLLLDDLGDDLVRGQAPGLDDLLDLHAQFGSFGDLLPEDVPRGDVHQVVLLHQQFGLGALTGAGRAEQGDVEHGSSPWFR